MDMHLQNDNNALCSSLKLFIQNNTNNFVQSHTTITACIHFFSFISQQLPCIACMKTDGRRERKSTGIEFDSPSRKYDKKAAANASAIAARPPKMSPKRPNKGPPPSCTSANVVCRYPNITGSAPSLLVKYC